MNSTRSKHPIIGDVVEISTPKGFAYAQYTHKHPQYGALLRILPGVYESRPAELSDLVTMLERFVVFFPLGSAVSRHIVSIVAHCPVPAESQKFPVFRSGVKNPETGRVDTWWLWDGKQEWKAGKLTKEQEMLPIRGIWNDTLLIERIVRGWSPADEV